jgi:hypothetical protein
VVDLLIPFVVGLPIPFVVSLSTPFVVSLSNHALSVVVQVASAASILLGKSLVRQAHHERFIFIRTP